MQPPRYKDHSSLNATFHSRPMLSLISVTLLAAACGGGGGGGESGGQTGAAEVPQAVVSSEAPRTTEELVENADAFAFRAMSGPASEEALNAVAGGSKVHSSWNPWRGEMLTPGMKVSFFGLARGCAAELSDGPVHASTAVPDGAALSKMALSSSASAFVRDWQPGGHADACDNTVREAAGPSRVVLKAGTNGGIGLFTTAVALNPDGSQPFFGPYAAGGQDGRGANAYNTSSFVTYRFDWRAAPHRPWVQNSPGAPSVMRIHTVQSVGLADVRAPDAASLPVQAKQFLAVAFINNVCADDGITPSRPCAVKYLFPLAIAQTGVQDWSKVDWFQKARVWFDPVQGGMPIVEGSPPASGVTMIDGESGLPVFRSAGEAARHSPFAELTFDLRVTHEQLINVLRIVASRQLQVTPSLVSESQMEALWGAAWNDPAQWSLVTAAVGQEVHNPYADGVSTIGGAFSSVYVGPQR
jgi:hypothetical protein